MTVGKNNPRVFAETVRLDAWRAKYDDSHGVADLHIDVIFAPKGRVGGGDAPVRFLLSLKRAEVHVVCDAEHLIEILPETVMRAKLAKPAKLTRKRTSSAALKGKAGVGASKTGVTAEAALSASGSVQIDNSLKQTIDLPAMEINHLPSAIGYGFALSTQSAHLKGQPWDSKVSVMRLRDKNAKRKKGERPEVRIEVHCLREDLHIEEIVFTDKKMTVWSKLTKSKRIAVEQFIKDELSKAGLECGDISDAFARIKLADAMPSEVL